jgi:hypothetical protein
MEEDQKEEQNEQKISLPEMIILTLICGGADLFCIFADLLSITVVLIPVAQGLRFLASGFAFVCTTLWLIIRRIKGIWALLGNLIGAVPGIGDFFPRTITLWLTISMVNRPIKIPGVEKVLQAATKSLTAAK